MELTRLLIQKGANVNARTGLFRDRTALEDAAYAGQAGTVNILLLNGAAINRRTLYFAITQGHVDVVRLLLGAGADPRWVLNYGKTVMQVAQESPSASRDKMVETVRLFLEQ